MFQIIAACLPHFVCFNTSVEISLDMRGSNGEGGALISLY